MPSIDNQVPPGMSESPPTSSAWVDLSTYRTPAFQGRGVAMRLAWYIVSLLCFESGWLLASGIKVRLLRVFGATVGEGVVIKPQVRIKFPWRLSVGDHVWIGQQVWIDNLDQVFIGSHVCISQGAYFCTGGHDHRRSTFDLVTRAITVDDGAWVGAMCIVMGGVRIGANAIAAAGCVVTRNVDAGSIVGGNPSRVIGTRQPPAERSP